MIRAGLITFNDAPTIQMTLDSLYSKVDEIIAIDGPFVDYSPEMSSTDGTLEILESWGVKTITGRWESQVAKRNAYCRRIKTSDWLLVIDADEILCNGYFLDQLDHYGEDYWLTGLFDPNPSMIQNKKNMSIYQTTIFSWYRAKDNRLIKATAPLSYHKRHYFLFRGDESIWNRADNPTCPVYILHANVMRPSERLQTKGEFYIKRRQDSDEGMGFWSFWLYNNCWRDCKYRMGEKDFSKCVNIRKGKCNAVEGKIDCLRGKEQWIKT
jgi:glycosyltransferase involved in cell wall biosynthesis